jgi:glycine oxidase
MDVVVIGGGVIGLLSALRLAQRGHSVRVIERGEPGREASWAAAGILGAQAEADRKGPLLDLCLRSRELYPALAAELGDIGFSRCGVLRLAFTEAEAEQIREQQAWQAGAGLRAELVRHPGARLALWQPDDGVVDNRMLTGALRSALDRARVPLLRVRAARLRFGRDALEAIETDREVLPTRRVVVAAGAWSAEIAGSGIAAGALVPVRGLMIAYDSPPPASVIFGGGGYAVPRPGRVLIGATLEHEGFDRRTTPEGLAWLREVAARLLPELAGLQPSEHWAGLRPGSRDGLPLLGRTLPGVVVATGHYRNGILLAPATAELVVQLVEGASPELRAFAPGRFQDAPVASRA